MYYGDHGFYPNELSAITPEYMRQLPRTPWQGDYRYRSDGKMYAIECCVKRRERPALLVCECEGDTCRMDTVY